MLGAATSRTSFSKSAVLPLAGALVAYVCERGSIKVIC